MINRIIIEGPDCCGKSTIIKRLLKLSNYQFDVLDRGDISNAVYAEMYGRECFYNRLNWKNTLHIVLYRDYYECEKIAKAKGEIYTEAEYNDQINLFKKYYNKLRNIINITSCDITGMTPELATAVIFRLINSINKSGESKLINNHYKDMAKIGCDKLKLKYVVDGSQIYINDKPIIDDIWLDCYGKIYSLNDVDNIENYLFAYFCGYNLNNIFDISNWEQRQFDIIYIINSKLSKRPEAEKALNLLITKYNFKVKSSLTKKLYGDDYINLLKTAKATIYIGNDLISFNALTARIYESLYAGNIIFFDAGFDSKRYFNLCFGKDAYNYKQMLIFDNWNDAGRKIKFVLNDIKLCKIILSYQKEFLIKLLKKGKLWK